MSVDFNDERERVETFIFGEVALPLAVEAGLKNLGLAGEKPRYFPEGANGYQITVMACE